MMKKYIARLVFRLVVGGAIAALYFLRPEAFSVLEGMRFFDRFSLLHILWIVWMFNMILQMIPLKNFIALGSQKLFKRYYRSKDADKSVSKAEKHNFIRKSNKGAAAVMVIWMTITAAIGFLFKNDLINTRC